MQAFQPIKMLCGTFTDEELQHEERRWRGLANANRPLDHKRGNEQYYLLVWLEMQRRGLATGES